MELALLAAHHGGLYTEDGRFGIANRGFTVFGQDVYWYAVCIVCGMILAAFLSGLLMRRRNMSPDFVYLLFIVCIPSAIVCARLYACLADPNLGIQSFFDFQGGGLSILGGVMGGVLAGFLVCLIKKVNFLRAADCVVINILIAQSLGRWGNFFNGEVYGGTAITDPAWQWFPFAVPIAGNVNSWTVGGIGGFSDPAATWYPAFFFYESVINLIGWALLFTLAWKIKKKPNGILTCLYFVWYGAVRTVMEPLRDQQFIYDNMASQLTAALMMGLGIAAILLIMIFNFKKEKAFVGSRVGDPCALTHYMTPYKDDKPYFSKINMFGDKYPPKPVEEKKPKRHTPKPPPSDRAAGDSGLHRGGGE